MHCNLQPVRNKLLSSSAGRGRDGARKNLGTYTNCDQTMSYTKTMSVLTVNEFFHFPFFFIFFLVWSDNSNVNADAWSLRPYIARRGGVMGVSANERAPRDRWAGLAGGYIRRRRESYGASSFDNHAPPTMKERQKKKACFARRFL